MRGANAGESSPGEALGEARGEAAQFGDADQLPVHRDTLPPLVHAVRLQVGTDRRTDDAARRRPVHENRNTGGSDLGAGAERGEKSESDAVYGTFQ